MVEPFRARIKGSGVGRDFANFFADVRDNAIFVFWAVTADWVAKNPKAATDVRAALDEGLDFIRANPDEAKKSQITHLGLPPEVVANLPLPTFENKVDPVEVKFWVDLSKEMGVISKSLEVKDLIVP